jgi:hypothetical protein
VEVPTQVETLEFGVELRVRIARVLRGWASTAVLGRWSATLVAAAASRELLVFRGHPKG